MHTWSDIVPPDKRTPGIVAIDPVIFPILDKLYERRIKRLNAQAHALGENGEYYRFLSQIVSFQQQNLALSPLQQDEITAIHAVISREQSNEQLENRLLGITCWQTAYARLITRLEAFLPQEMLQRLSGLLTKPQHLARLVVHLLRAEYQLVNPGSAVVIWAALSACWAQAITSLQKNAVTHPIAQSVVCPCCGAPPVASLVLGGAREGLRYLQCSLCETRWHRVRAVCIACEETSQIDHWTLDDTKSAIQIETCGDCKSYIKTFRLDYDPTLEAVADDIGSFTLDKVAEAEGFLRIGINPFSFPA